MNEVKRIAEGTSAFLQYEYCCLRGNLFSESYLSSGVGGILQSLHGGLSAQVIAGYQHPTLAALMEKGGRRPELDFVVSMYDDSITNNRARTKKDPVRNARDTKLLITAIETKWAGSTHCTTANIVWDILRLEMLVAENPKITAILLLAGHTNDMTQLRKIKNLESLISFESGSRTLSLLPKDKDSTDLFAELFKDKSLQSMIFPKKIVITSFSSALISSRADKMCVIAWQIKPVAKRETFKPSEISAYIYSEEEKKKAKREERKKSKDAASTSPGIVRKKM